MQGRRFTTTYRWAYAVLCAALCTLLACGQSDAAISASLVSLSPSPVTGTPVLAPLVPGADEATTAPVTTPELHTQRASWDDFIHSPDYTGELVVKFSDASGVLWSGESWMSAQAKIQRALTELHHRYPDAELRKTIDLPNELVDRARRRAQRLGKQLHNWNRVFSLHIAEPTQAAQLLRELQNLSFVDWAHPLLHGHVSSPNEFSTPDLSGEQSYLFAENGGLNILEPQASYGLTGAGQTFIDVESYWNYEHADLAIDESLTPLGAAQENSGVAATQLNHGTAVLGVVTAQANAMGTTGIAHGALPRTSVSSSGALQKYMEKFAGTQHIAGHVVLIEKSMHGPMSQAWQSSDAYTQISADAGTVPFEAASFNFALYQDLTAMGVVVVEGAANGVADLDDPIHQFKNCGSEPCPFLGTDDSGALMVGASTGPSLAKADFSNCGSRVNVFAWGAGVVTTGYGDYGLRPLAIIHEDGNEVCFPYAWTELPSAELQNLLTEHVCSVKPFFCNGVEKQAWPGVHCPAGYLAVPNDGQMHSTADFNYWYDDNPNTPELPVDDPNHWYTASFGGTSSATAIIGGLVVLLQEHTRNLFADELTHDWEYAYLNAWQVRELLTHPEVGTPQSDDGCTIGMQPDLGKALALLDSGVIPYSIGASAGYCDAELSGPCLESCALDPLDPAANCGAICDHDPTHALCTDWCVAKMSDASDPGFNPITACAETIATAPLEFATWCVEHAQAEDSSFDVAADCAPIFQPTAAAHDLDGDGRADVIAWSQAEQRWYIDRSGYNPTASTDAYGSWDLVLDVLDPVLASGRVLPVVQDYNSDGHADLALYYADAGLWKIKYTKTSWLTADYTLGNWQSWDEIADYSGHPSWQPGSRPFTGEFATHYLVRPVSSTHVDVIQPVDRVLVTPAGRWLFDHRLTLDDTTGSIDIDFPLLSAEHVAAAPGWAYLPIPVPSYNGNSVAALTKIPDGLDNENQILTSSKEGFDNPPEQYSVWPYSWNYQFDLGNNATFLVPGQFPYSTSTSKADLGFRTSSGEWSTVKFGVATDWAPAPPLNDLGDITCRPVGADYDGDGIIEPAVFCEDGSWRVHYSSTNELRTIDYGQPMLALPAEVCPGGMAYQDIIDLYAPLNFGCPPEQNCTIFDLPAPTGPRFAQCIAQNEAEPLECLGY